jgi:predicted permease
MSFPGIFPTALVQREGSTRVSLIRSSSLVVMGGLIVAVIVAYGGIQLLLALAPPNLGGVSIQLDATVLGFTAFIGVAAGIFFGLIPALQITGGQDLEALKEGGRFGTGSRMQLRFRSILVTLEIALALVLLVGVGLFLRSLSNLQRVDTGFDPKGVMTGMVALPPVLSRDVERRVAFHRAVVERLATVPGVSHAATGFPIPFVGDSGGAFAIEGVVNAPDQPAPGGRVRVISPDYFATLGIPLLRGRPFTDADTTTTEPVVVIDESLARQYWPNEDPIGKRIRRTLPNAPWTTIVGIVRHVKHSELGADSDRGVHYYPIFQGAQEGTAYAVLVRTSLEPTQLSNAIREAVRAVDPLQPVFDLRTMEDRVFRDHPWFNWSVHPGEIAFKPAIPGPLFRSCYFCGDGRDRSDHRALCLPHPRQARHDRGSVGCVPLRVARMFARCSPLVNAGTDRDVLYAQDRGMKRIMIG